MGGGLKTPMKSTKINYPLIFMFVLYRTSKCGRRVHGRREESEVGGVCGQEGGGGGGGEEEGGGVRMGRGVCVGGGGGGGGECMGREEGAWVRGGRGGWVGSWSAVACVLQTTAHPQIK